MLIFFWKQEIRHKTYVGVRRDGYRAVSGNGICRSRAVGIEWPYLITCPIHFLPNWHDDLGHCTDLVFLGITLTDPCRPIHSIVITYASSISHRHIVRWTSSHHLGQHGTSPGNRSPVPFVQIMGCLRGSLAALLFRSWWTLSTKVPTAEGLDRSINIFESGKKVTRIGFPAIDSWKLDDCNKHL